MWRWHVLPGAAWLLSWFSGSHSPQTWRLTELSLGVNSDPFKGNMAVADGWVDDEGVDDGWMDVGE